MSLVETLHFMLMGLIGALLYVLFWAKSWQDLKRFESVRHILCGILVGYVYSLLHSNYGFPDLVMGMVAGWMGVDFIQALIERFKSKQSEDKA